MKSQVASHQSQVGNQLPPPLKWAGGKRWQVPRLSQLWRAHAHRRLVEPFCGGLAVALFQLIKDVVVDREPRTKPCEAVEGVAEEKTRHQTPESHVRSGRDLVSAKGWYTKYLP